LEEGSFGEKTEPFRGAGGRKKRGGASGAGLPWSRYVQEYVKKAS